METLVCACGCGESVRRVRYPNCQQQPRFRQGHQHKGANNGNYRGGKEQHCCPVCNTSFMGWRSQGHVTCGKDACYRTWQGLTTAARGRNKQAVACSTCGAELRLFPSQIWQRNYCTRLCQGRDKSRLFAGGLNKRWKGGRWHYVQEQAFIRDQHRCVICGFDFSVDVHHSTPRRQGGTDDFGNLMTLCPNHHRLADLGMIAVEHLRNETWEPGPATSPHPHDANH